MVSAGTLLCAAGRARIKRQRGSIRKRGNSYLVEVYAGIDPLTGRRRYLNGSTTDGAEADRILTRLLAQVDAQRHARTNATLGYAIDEWLSVQELEQTTRESYQMYVRRYIKPAFGDVPLPKVSARVLEQFYASSAGAAPAAPAGPRSTIVSMARTSVG